nr:SurA N-terminal domain-containing protein [Thauera aminoaromatica]
MKQLLSRTRVAIAIGLAAATLALPGHAAPRAVEVDRIVAVVNNEVITGLELRSRIEQTRRQLARQGVELPPEDVLQRQLLERLIVERAQLQLARESSLRVDDATLDRAIERIASNNKLSIEQLRATLEKDGVTWSRFRDEIRSEILLTRLREREVDSRIVVTDAEIDNFIANNPDAFSGQEFAVAHILLRTPEGASPQQVEAVARRAEQVMARLRSGEDFARVAAEVSDAPDGLQGGGLGWRPLDRLPAL